MTKPAFRFKHYDLGMMKQGVVIEVALNAVNNVRLMADAHFKRFSETQPHRYLGGPVRKSPVRLAIPEDGHWHIIVDGEGHHGLAESSVKMLAGVKAAG